MNISSPLQLELKLLFVVATGNMYMANPEERKIQPTLSQSRQKDDMKEKNKTKQQNDVENWLSELNLLRRVSQICLKQSVKIA